MRDNHKLQYAALARELDATPHDGRGTLIARAATLWNCSQQSVYRKLASVGWSSGRKARADKGKTRVDEAHLLVGAALVHSGFRKNGKSAAPMTEAYSVLVGNDIDPKVSVDHFRRLATARGLGVKQVQRPTAHQSMRVPHVNYLHQVDASVCVIYYFNGQQHIKREEEFYKNKEHNTRKVRLKVWRYALWEAASGAIKVRYFEAAGETSRNLAEFLLWAWSDDDMHPPYGVPKYLYMDAGSANTAYALHNLCEALEVKIEHHMPEAARATGGVENSHNIIERSFEFRLKIKPAANLDELNQRAAEWSHAFNEDQIEGKDSRIRRHGRKIDARANLWRMIRSAEMRHLPPLKLCRALMEGKTVERVVKGGLEFTFKHPESKVSRTYSVSGLDAISVGDTVRVTALAYGDLKVRVRIPIYNGDDRVYDVEPRAELDQFGNYVDSAVWFESHKSHKGTLIEGQVQRLNELEYPDAKTDEDLRKARASNKVPLLGVLNGKDLDPFTYLKNATVPTTLPRRGETIDVPDHATPAPVAPLTHFAACKRIAAQLGRALSPDENAQVRAWYPDGVPEDSLPMVATCVANGTTPFNAQRAPLRAAG